MTDTEILNALQHLVDEHFAAGKLGFDFEFCSMTMTVKRPLPVFDGRLPIRSGRRDLREALAGGLQPHLARLVTRALTEPHT